MNKWDKKSIDKLKEMYENKIPCEEIAKKLGRTIKAVRNKAYKMNITNTENRYTDEEINFLKNNYHSYNLKEISKKLNKNKSNVCRKVKELGLDRTNLKVYPHLRKTKKNELGNYVSIDWVRKSKEEIGLQRSEIMKKHIKKYGHCRGMLGKTHSIEEREKMRKRAKKLWKDPNSTFNSEEFRQLKSDIAFKNALKSKKENNYSRSVSGKRPDLNNQFFRSKWEANYARFLNLLIKQNKIYKWEYEVDTFIFSEIKKGIRSYTPDFKIWETKESIPYYVEIKGWLDNKSKTKLKRMEKYYPSIKIVMFMEKEYKELKLISHFIKGWEF